MLHRLRCSESLWIVQFVYKRDADASGAYCGPLSNAEKAELDKMTLEEVKDKWARVNPKTIKKAGQSSAYRGVSWCVA